MEREGLIKDRDSVEIYFLSRIVRWYLNLINCKYIVSCDQSSSSEYHETPWSSDKKSLIYTHSYTVLTNISFE